MGEGAGCGNARETSTGAFLTDRGTHVEDPSPRSMKARRFPMVLKALLLMPAAFVPADDEPDTDCGHSRVHAEAMERFRTTSPEPHRPVDIAEAVGAGVQLRFSVERVVVDRMRAQRLNRDSVAHRADAPRALPQPRVRLNPACDGAKP